MWQILKMSLVIPLFSDLWQYNILTPKHILTPLPLNISA